MSKGKFGWEILGKLFSQMWVGTEHSPGKWARALSLSELREQLDAAAGHMV